MRKLNYVMNSRRKYIIATLAGAVAAAAIITPITLILPGPRPDLTAVVVPAYYDEECTQPVGIPFFKYMEADGSFIDEIYVRNNSDALIHVASNFDTNCNCAIGAVPTNPVQAGGFRRMPPHSGAWWQIGAIPNEGFKSRNCLFLLNFIGIVYKFQITPPPIVPHTPPLAVPLE